MRMTKMQLAGCYVAWINMLVGGSYWQFVCATDYLNGRR
jgi:hypothetical protein